MTGKSYRMFCIIERLAEDAERNFLVLYDTCQDYLYLQVQTTY